MTKEIIIKNARVNNLKGVDVVIPLGKLVAIVGKSGSGKTSLIRDVLIRASEGHEVKAQINFLPKIFKLDQQLRPEKGLSQGETVFKKMGEIVTKIKKGELLIVDEPCAGLARPDREKILACLRELIGKGVSVIIIEHSKDVIASADYVIEIGPDSGCQGGEVVFQGSLSRYKGAKTPTSGYVFSNKAGLVNHKRDPNFKALQMQGKLLKIEGINKNNLVDFDFILPLGQIVCLSGRVGKGKTTILEFVYQLLFKGKNAWQLRKEVAGHFSSIEGKTFVRRSYFVDQSPLNRVKTSSPATYLGVWSNIKKLKPKDLSLGDLEGKTIDEALVTFENNPLIVRKLGFLKEVGLGYLTLGQKSGTLSGGEAQRVRLAKILSKKLGDRCVYILDTPSRGLHLSDLPTLNKVFQKIVDKNNTILIADNREELIKNSDFNIEL